MESHGTLWVYPRPAPRKAAARAAAPAAEMPPLLEPMLATASSLPTDADQYSVEWKWDGVRAMTYFDRGRPPRWVMRSRNQHEITSRYPELDAMASALHARQAILDGEVVALDDAGRASFRLLQRRMHVAAPTPALLKAVTILYVVFDILHHDGRSLMDLPLSERRRHLQAVVPSGAHWQVTSAHDGDEGAAMLEAARANGLEGVVAKRLDSRYEPGRRSPAWRKVKVVLRQEFVLGGWVPEAGSRTERVGSMLLGYYDREGLLHYAGRVGTGLDDSDHAMLMPLFRKHRRKTNPFSEPAPGSTVKFLNPAMVAEIEYRRWPESGLVQQGAFKGVRFDKNPRQVVKEPTPGIAKG